MMLGRRRRATQVPVKEEAPGAENSRGATRYDEGRRNFLKVAVVASAVIAAVGLGALVKSVANPAPIASVATGFPKVKVASLSDLQAGKPLLFYYPLDNEPNLLVKLGQAAENGVGPDGDIVAFSQYCQHLGCVYGYQAPGTSPKCNTSYLSSTPVGYCCCHGSVFDFAGNGKVLSGPSPRPIPRVILEVDGSNDIYAVGMTPPAIFGHNTGSNDVSSDLQGGNLVTG